MEKFKQPTPKSEAELEALWAKAAEALRQDDGDDSDLPEAPPLPTKPGEHLAMGITRPKR